MAKHIALVYQAFEMVTVGNKIFLTNLDTVESFYLRGQCSWVAKVFLVRGDVISLIASSTS